MKILRQLRSARATLINANLRGRKRLIHPKMKWFLGTQWNNHLSFRVFVLALPAVSNMKGPSSRLFVNHFASLRKFAKDIAVSIKSTPRESQNCEPQLPLAPILTFFASTRPNPLFASIKHRYGIKLNCSLLLIIINQSNLATHLIQHTNKAVLPLESVEQQKFNLISSWKVFRLGAEHPFYATSVLFARGEALWIPKRFCSFSSSFFTDFAYVIWALA